MSKKHSFRRSVAGILAVLTVTGNLIAPAQVRLPLAPASIEVDAASLMGNKNVDYEWDNETKTLTIKQGISNVGDVVGTPDPDPLSFNVNMGTWLNWNYIQPDDVKHIVIDAGAVLPQTWESMFTKFVNLESFKIVAEVDASNVYNFGSAFKGLTKLTDVDLSGMINTGNVDYVENMFNGCSSLKKIDLSMLTGQNTGKRNWTAHDAIDHVRRAVAGCNQLEELDLTGEFLYNALHNINKVDGTQLSIEQMIDILLQDNFSPYKDQIKQSLIDAYEEYLLLMQDPYTWKAKKNGWKWKQHSDQSWTCKVTLERIDPDTHRKVEKTEDANISYIDDPQPTCYKEGTRHYIATWSEPDSNLVLRYEGSEDHTSKLAKYAHNYQVSGFTWNENHTAATVTLRCPNNGCGATKTVQADRIESTVVAPTCENPGYTVYVAYYGDVESEPETVEGEAALGHVWSEEGTWTWNGVESAQVEIACTREGCTKTVTLSGDAVTITSAVTKQPTCTTAGVRTYTATAVYEGKTYTDTKTEEIPTEEHEFTEFVRFVWAADNKSAQVELKCKDCDATTLVAASMSSDYTPATCTSDGYTVYTATYEENSDFRTVYDAGSQLEHEFTEFVRFVWAADSTSAQVELKCKDCDATTLVAAEMSSDATPATCTSDGFTVYTATYGDQSDFRIIMDSGSMLGHEPGEPTIENVIAPTLTSPGSHDVVVRCTHCGEVLSRETVEDPALKAELINPNQVGFKENIILRFFANISDELTEGAYVEFTYDHYGEEKTVRADIDTGKTINYLGTKHYIFDCPLSVPELAVDVTAKLYVSESEEAVSEGIGSVVAYCDRMIGAQSAALDDALIALLNLGGYAQTQHNLNTDNLANAGRELDLADITIPESGEFIRPEETVGGVKYQGAALGMRDQIVTRYYFTAASLEGVTFIVNGAEQEAKYDTKLKMYYVDADPVKAMDVTKVNEIIVSTADGDISFSHSALDYAAAHCDDSALGKEMKAMYNYYLKVKAYVEGQ